MPSWCFWTCCGRISDPRISRRPWRNTREGSGGSVLDLAERQSSRWGDLGIRVLSALVLTPIALACVWLGGVAFTLCIAVVALGLVVEWLTLCGRRSPFFGVRAKDVDGRATPHCRVALPFGWFSIGLLYVAVAGGALLWLRADPVSGRADVLFLLLIV